MRQAPELKPGDRVELTILSIVFGGDGLGKHQGFVIFVPYVLPGETVLVEITEVKKGYARAKLINILISADSRVQPPCPYYGECGGCDLQHTNYAAQLEIKSTFVSDAAKKFRLEFEQVLPILASPKELHYRNRIQLQSVERNQKLQLGFRKPKSHSVVDIKECKIADKRLNSALSELRTTLITKPKQERWDLRLLPSGEIKTSSVHTEDQEFGFSQVNTEQNLKMIEIVQALALKTQAKTIWDLYAGYGNLSHGLLKAQLGVTIHAVEGVEAAVTLGKKLYPEIHFHNMYVDDFVRKATGAPDLVILDPPRTGAGPEVMKHLARLNIKNLISISCDPMTWGRDLSVFFDESTRLGHAYSLKSLQPLDMFPQTHHVELISVLTRT